MKGFLKYLNQAERFKGISNQIYKIMTLKRENIYFQSTEHIIFMKGDAGDCELKCVVIREKASR